MVYETVKRNKFDDPDPARLASHVSKYHSEDVQDFHLPLERMHNSNLHDWGIARGLEVSGTVGSTEIIVHPGVAIDRDGQLISLSELGEIHENPSEEQSEESIVPVHLSTGNHAGKTVYVTIQFFERLRSSEGVLGMLEQVPWIRLQPVDAYDGESIVLAIAVLKEAGKLDELKTMDNALPHRRQLIGQSIEELEIQRSGKIGNVIKEIPSGKIGPGDGGGLKITVPGAQDSILFAREDGSNFSNLEIHSNVGIGTSFPSEKLEVNGTVKANKFVGDGSGLTKAGQWTDVEGGISYNAGNVGIGTTNPKAKIDIAGDLLVQGKVGIRVQTPSENLEVLGNIRIHPQASTPGSPVLVPRNSWILVGSGNDNQARALNFSRRLLIIPRPGPDPGPINPNPKNSITVGDGWNFNARSKNFLIDHPLHPDTHELVHSTLEGPETAVFYRGEAQLSGGEATVTLPDYFEALTRKENRTVLLTPEFEEGLEVSTLAASKVKDGKFTVKMVDSKNPSQKFYWEVKAVRADVDILEVETEKPLVNLSD